MLGEGDASSGEKTAPYHNHLGINRVFRSINGAGIAPKWPRLKLEAKPFDEHGSSIDAAQRGYPPDLGLSDGLDGS
jgi:hypothetical protein